MTKFRFRGPGDYSRGKFWVGRLRRQAFLKTAFAAGKGCTLSGGAYREDHTPVRPELREKIE
jgi:hypothetical protein